MRLFSEFYFANRENLDGALLDVDGTLSANGAPLPGAAELLVQFEKDRFPYLLLTNDTCHSHEEKQRILANGGIHVPMNRIFSAGDVLRYWAGKNYHGELFFQCGVLGKPGYGEAAGIQLTTDVKRIPECKGVLMGEGIYAWQENLEGIFNLFMAHPEYPFVVCNPDSYWPSVSGTGMGVGAGGQARFICGLLKEMGISVEPVYLGKPYAPVYQQAFQVFAEQYPERPAVRAERVIMLGDSLASDIRGGNVNGLLSCLVLTGITSRKLAEDAEEIRRPKEIFDRI